MLTRKHTQELGFREGLAGTRYLRAAVNYIVPRTGKRPLLHGEVYPVLADEFGITVSAVEAAIRNTIRQSKLPGRTLDVIVELVQRCRDGEFTA